PTCEALFTDGTARVTVRWFHQPYLARRLPRGSRVLLTGTLAPGYPFTLANPEWEPLEPGEVPDATPALVPIYPGTEGLPRRWFRKLLMSVAEGSAAAAREFLPAPVLAARDLLPLATALRALHLPASLEEAAAARRRLAYEELFLLAFGLALRRAETAALKSLPLRGDSEREAAVLRALPFALTGAQERAVAEITAELGREQPMHRLLHGEVGSGKTVVALLAALRAVSSASQAALLAPTDLLAEQLAERAERLLAPGGVRVGLLRAGQRAAERRAVLEGLATRSIGVVVGTHAILEEGVRFARLGLAVVDEQHRFGVAQRLTLAAKGTHPHLLVMSATPIPRSLALSLYGDLDLTALEDLPPGRRRVATVILPAERRADAALRIREEVARGRAAYVVCPQIALGEDADAEAAAAAEAHLVALRRGLLRGLRLGLLHGRLRAADREGAMRRFRDGGFDVLVATTVVEVGVDVPRATVMVVEGADRFGLAQLHQLRGRVGRGEDPGTCYLIPGPVPTEGGMARLEALVRAQDGFAVAEADLTLRGGGDLLGTRQAGLPPLSFASLGDAPLLTAAREDAVNAAGGGAGLDAEGRARLLRALRSRWAGALAPLRSG
ncbi:MAG: ATP-dependent DNA helicase RecG, partial [candidate division NC10 bacterium]|nr:ATP-dependent DNA helicase RecG [candidate division NC10 bacterium]